MQSVRDLPIFMRDICRALRTGGFLEGYPPEDRTLIEAGLSDISDAIADSPSPVICASEIFAAIAARHIVREPESAAAAGAGRGDETV